VHHRATGALRGEEASINPQDAHVQHIALGSPAYATETFITAFKTTLTGRAR
jgi:ABC-type arginine transport system permease subunit